MIKRVINLCITISVFLSACASQPALTSTPVAEGGATITAGLPPTLPPTNTPTPTPALPSQGPYLLVSSDHSSFTLMSPNGKGTKKFTIPDQGIIPYPLESAISPNGEWLAYHTGSYKQPPYDLTLHLYNISNGGTRTIAAVISPDYLEYQLTSSQMSFILGIKSLAWSPDGRFLAFAAQIGGPSSDLYLYDLEEDTMHRLSDEIYNIFKVEWSPEGKWILYEDTIPSHDYHGGTLYAIEFNDGIVSKTLELETGFWWQGIGWLTEDNYLITGVSDGGPPSELRYHNLKTNQVIPLCPYAHYSIAFDPGQERIVYSCDSSEFEADPSSPYNKPGLYYAYLDGRSGQFTEQLYFNLTYQGGARPRFLTTDQAGLISISLDGSATTIYTPGEEAQDHFWREQIAISPDQSWAAVYGPDGFKLFDANDEIRFQVEDSFVFRTFWRPDSQGVFIYYGSDPNNAYYSIPENSLTPIDFCSLGHCPLADVVWLP